MRPLQSLPALLAAGLTAATVGLSAPAKADAAAIKDAPNDVRVTTFPSDGSALVVVIDPDDAGDDITRAVVKHSRNRVKVTVHVRDLRARSMPTLQVRFKTNNGSYRVWLSKEPLVGTQLLILTPERLDAVRSCHGPRQSYKPALDIVAFSVPRRCLDNPRWIRAQTALLEAQFVEGETTDDLTITEFQDMAGPTGKVPLFVFTKNSTTPKLFRG